MALADKFVHPTIFTGDWPNWNGYTWLDWVNKVGSFHPADDYNKGSGNDDLGQKVVSTANGIVFHTSERTVGYGKVGIVEHKLGYKLKKFIKDTYGLEVSSLYSLYAHLKDIQVKVGQEVTCGQLIGHVGKSGTIWSHLHFELYHLDGDLKYTSYRFYPFGWSKEKIKQNWLPSYSFIEATKNIESYETFLGKSKDYWLQVEKDREELIKQLGNKTKDCLKITEPLSLEITKLEKKIKQLNITIANDKVITKKVEVSHQKALEKKDIIIGKKDEKIVKLQNKITLCLKKKASEYSIIEAFILLVNSFKGGGKGEQNKKSD